MKAKINHPFKVPDQFFDHLNTELLNNMEKVIRHEKKQMAIMQVIKYAAIVTAAIFLGRGSVLIFPDGETAVPGQEIITVDLILSQVPEEDITDFIIENVENVVINE